LLVVAFHIPFISADQQHGERIDSIQRVEESPVVIV